MVVVFQITGSSLLPSSYLSGDSHSEISELMQKALDCYIRCGSSVEVLMGKSVQDVTQSAVITVSELFKRSQELQSL